MNKEKIIRVVLADDHRIVREGLRSVLEKDSQIQVVGETSDGNEVVRFAKKCLPDIVIMDVSMPNLSGIEATQQITKEVPEVKVIMLSMHFDKHLIYKAFLAGAKSYLRKDSASQELIEAIRVVANNKNYLSPTIGLNRSGISLTQKH